MSKLRRVPISADELVGNTVVFSAPNARYLHRVLRLRPGDHLNAFYGECEYLVELSDVSRAGVHGRVLEAELKPRDDALDVTLGFACVRPGPVEKILRHCTELGVSHFVPILSARANRKPENYKPRWRTIIAAATGQCGRIAVPDVEPPVSFTEFLRKHTTAATKILLSTSASAPPLLVLLDQERPTRVVLLVGPEGGLDEAEELQAVREGFHGAGLGSAVLRTETAAVAAAGVVVAWHQSRTWATGSPEGKEMRREDSNT